AKIEGACLTIGILRRVGILVDVAEIRRGNRVSGHRSWPGIPGISRITINRIGNLTEARRSSQHQKSEDAQRPDLPPPCLSEFPVVVHGTTTVSWDCSINSWAFFEPLTTAW